MSCNIKLFTTARVLIAELISYRGTFMAFKAKDDRLLVLSRSPKVKSFMDKIGLSLV
jgi:hypothetical protein